MVLKDFIGVCFPNMNLNKNITEDGQNVQIHVQKLKAKLWTYPDVMQRWKLYKVFLERFPLSSYFLIGATSHLQR